MLKKRSTKLMCLLIAFVWMTIVIGSSYAYYIQNVDVANNVVAMGDLQAELYWRNPGETSWQDASKGAIFNHRNWEPGYSDVKYLNVRNTGDLAFQYELNVFPAELLTGRANLLDVIDVYYGENVENVTRDNYAIKLTRVGTMTELLTNEHGAGSGILLPENSKEDVASAARGSVEACMVLHMQETAGNEYQGLSVGDGFTVQLAAAHYMSQTDSFGTRFDQQANDALPVLNIPTSMITDVTPAGGLVPYDVHFSNPINGVSATVPAGAKMADGATSLKLVVERKQNSDAKVNLTADEELFAYNVKVIGLAADNTVPVIINMGEVLPNGLNLGNYDLYHVENGVTVKMTLVDSADLDAHNEFTYDPVNGAVSVAMATFSEVALVADTENAWKGKFDYSWYTNTVMLAEGETVTEYTIANADQLAAFGAIVGGMDGQTQNSFSGKTVKLVADVNLGDKESENNPDLIFYPIGYNSDDGKYEKTGVAVTTGFYAFEGTFDGNGHTIANFYQNTWEMKGDNNYYDATLQYYRDGMGLFGKVYGGTVKNLTVDNFSSDGEYTTTGVIAAYADGATFENIAVTNCNPRVYNIGNGGIVGCVGWYAKEAGLQTTFKNITVDNSNKISALWGSYDVACGGILGQYYPTSGQKSADTPKNGGIELNNCHVSAIMDVYNDVCGNYQYYAYRYAGMMIGSIRENTTNDEGKTIPDMTGISATGCTVNYGDWNDYYYCEFEKNGHPSYAGADDYKFSRVPDSELNFTDSNGNGLVDADERASVTGCKHNHTDAEDNKAIYLPFHQLFTGYGWGVNSIGLKEYSGIHVEDYDLDIGEGDQEESVEKFEKADIAKESYTTESTVTVGELFKAATIKDEKLSIKGDKVQVFVSPVGENSTAGGTYTPNTTDWTQGTLTFSGIGAATITITDYYFCTETTITVNVDQIDKFETKFTGDFLYRVGNQNAVKLDSLFKAKADATIGTVDVTIENVAGNASGTYTSNDTWTNGTIQFSGTGVAKVTITDNDYCTPTELYLEVVDAVNATSATSATANNVVLLNDCGFSSLEVSGGYALYGNGFTMTCASDSVAADMGYAFVTLNNGTLDNVQIVCPNFDYAALYKSNLTSGDNRSETDSNGKTRYYNAKSGVMASGNSQILNSRVSGARAAVNVSGGNVLIDNSRVELGAVASILVGAANSLTLRDVTLVQKPTASTYDSSKTLMGFSVLFVCDANGDATPVTLEGALVQNAWVDENDKQYVPSAGQSIISTVLAKTEYLHDIDGDGTNESLNLGFAYMPESLTSKVNTTTITDNRTNKDTVPYDYAEVSILNGKTYVYSYKNTNGTADSFKTESEYVPNKYSDIITVTYSDTSDGLTNGKSFGTDGWVYELNVDLDKLSGYALDFSKLSMSVNGVTVTDFKVNGNAKPTSPVAVTAGGTTYTLTATVNGKEYTATYKVTGTETSKESPSLVASNYEAGLCVASSYGGTWHGAAPALEGIQIKYWSVAEKQYKTITLSDYTPTTAGKQNGTNTTWTYSPDNGDFTLTLTGGQVHSSNNVYAMPVVCDGKLYFVAASSNGLVNTGNSARTIPVSYTFKDNNNGDVLTFSHTWSVEENTNAQYKYSDFCNGTLTKLEAGSSSGGGCVTPDTLITLADGSKKEIQHVTYEDQLLVWDFYKGEYAAVPSALIVNHGMDDYTIIELLFDDGTRVKAVNAHAFFDADENKFVLIDAENAEEFIGHKFVKNEDSETKTVELVECKVYADHTASYTLVSAGHYSFLTEGIFSLTNAFHQMQEGLVVGDDLRYDEEVLKADIATYGVYTYEDYANYITEEQFMAFGGPHLKISVGKGYTTYEYTIDLIKEYLK